MKKKISIVLSIFILMLIILTLKSNATYSSNDPVVTSGGKATITVSSSESLQNYDLKLTSYTGLTYNKDCSKANEAGAIVEINKEAGAISYISTGEGTKTLGTYSFTVPEVTQTTTYKVNFDIDGTANTSTVTVNPKVVEQPPVDNTDTPEKPSTPPAEEKSSNANVKMIETSPVDFTGFRTGKTSGYEVNVENNVDRITVRVTKEDSKASVALLNRTNSDTGKSWVYIAEGNNEIDVTVTSEDGKNKKTYTMNVIRKPKEKTDEEEKEETEETEKEQEEEKPEEITEEQPKEEVFGLTELKIEGFELQPEFKTDIYEYSIKFKEDLEKLNISTLATEANANIEITGNENLQEGENIITIIVKNENEEKNAVYQITVNKELESNVVSDTINVEPDYKSMINEKIVIPAAVAVIIVVIIIIIAIVKNKNNSSAFEDERYISYGGLTDSFDGNNEEESVEDDFYQEDVKKKRSSKGKRFK